MEYNFQPYIGAGPLRFGMEPDEIKYILEDPDVTVIWNECPEDLGAFEYVYEKAGLRIHFNKARRVDTMSFTWGSVLFLDGVDLRYISIYELYHWICHEDPEKVAFKNFDIYSTKFGFLSCSPAAQVDLDMPARWITIFSREYLESMGRELGLNRYHTQYRYRRRGGFAIRPGLVDEPEKKPTGGGIPPGYRA